MKKILSYIMIVSLFISLAGCEQEDVVTSFNSGTDEQNLTLTLKFEEHDSRAVKTENELNENLIQKVDLFLYPTNGKNKSAIEEKKDLEPITTTSTEEGFVVNNDGTVTVKIKVSSGTISTLFPSGSNNECTAYAIANGPDIPDNATTSIDDLKAMAITSTFDEAADATTPGDGIQDSFVMDGQGTITKTTEDGKEKLEGNIELLRAAAKITLKVSEIVTEIKEGEDVTWKPETGGMKVFFYNGVKSSLLSAEVDVAGDRYNLQFGAGGIDGYVFASETQGENTVYNQEIPFYSYPSDWTKDQSKESYLVLLLPWRKNDAAQWTSFYYKIPISHVETVDGTTTSSSKMVRNTHYQIDVTVGILGAEENKGEVTLTPKYTLLNWGEETVDATLDKAHYLVVDKKKVEVYNQNEVKIGYKASEDISVVITEISKPDLNGDSNGKVTTTYFVQNGTNNNVAAGSYITSRTKKLLTACSVTPVVENESKFIKLSHVLINSDQDENQSPDGDNQTKNDYDYVPYTIKVQITMNYTVNGNKPFTEEIVYTQYPAMYIDAKPNSKPNNTGGVYGVSNYGGIHGLTGGNKNPNMYVVTTTALPSNSTYVIGDPRTLDRKDHSDWTTNAPSMYYGGDRDLDYYNPTDAEFKDNHRTFNMIAPKFRIASSYGVTNPISYDDAYKRCASYQEDGYPAGRWRMPTYAEYSYLVMFSYLNMMPALYTTSSQYWYAHGHGNPQSDGTVAMNLNENGNYYIRCVYDEWYWNDTCDKTIYTWGDKNL